LKKIWAGNGVAATVICSADSLMSGFYDSERKKPPKLSDSLVRTTKQNGWALDISITNQPNNGTFLSRLINSYNVLIKTSLLSGSKHNHQRNKRIGKKNNNIDVLLSKEHRKHFNAFNLFIFFSINTSQKSQLKPNEPFI
jgi:hypothetical protein